MTRAPKRSGEATSKEGLDGGLEGASAEEEAALQQLQTEIGLNVLLARRRQKLTQMELAERGDLRQATVFHAEAGQNNMTLRTLLRLARALNVAPRDLLPGPTPLGEAARSATESLAALDTSYEHFKVALREFEQVRAHITEAYDGIKRSEK